MDRARPTSSLYCRVTPTWFMASETMGRKAVASRSVVFRRKYSVAAVSLPFRIFSASRKLISRMASQKMALASGAARSAARFMLKTNSSTWSP